MHRNKAKALARQFRRNLCLRDQLAKAYFFVIMMCVASGLIFIISGLFVPHPLYEFAGIGIVASRASAIVVLLFAALSVLCISRDLNSFLRKRCCRD